jgi:diaminopimelate decarboxylase
MVGLHAELAPSWLTEPADVNLINSKVWPASFARDGSGGTVIGGLSVGQLVAEYGTPLMVIDQADFVNRAQSVKQAFDSEAKKSQTKATIYYASQSLSTTEVVRWVAASGLNIDVCSAGELALALAGGIEPSRIGLHGNNKSLYEIGRAVTAGVGAIVIDSEIEIERIASIAGAQDKVQNVRIRVNSGVHAYTHEYLATSREDQKFGIAIADVPELVAKIRSHSHLNFLGLHSHIGSQIFSVDGFLESVRRLMPLHKKLLETGNVSELNLGGGFGINYTEADQAPDIEVFAAAICKEVATQCQELGVAVPVLCFEPGRVISGPAGVTIYNVGTIKDVQISSEDSKGSRKYVSIDGGMSDNPRPSLYSADYSAVLASRSSAVKSVISRVVGKHCESGDIVVRDCYLPADISPNDLLAVAATGAYCHSLASNYNYLPRPAMIAVMDGKVKLLMRAESEADMLSRDPGYQAH